MALADVDLRVEPGERVGLIGPSGAGKTTLLSLMNATRTPTSGRVRIFGRDPTALSPEGRRRLQGRIGTIHQQFHLVDGLRVIHNVNAGRLGEWSFLRSLWSLLRPRETERARRILERVGIEEKMWERTGDLSGGEKQRVALSRVLAQDPDVILADEPIASLDRENSREVMDLLARLAREEGVTAVISLHEYEYALSHCERVVGLREGRVLFDRPPSEVSEEMVDRLYRLER
ncbi:MAG: phosphonate ABC transporter ATP-binding protein [Gemmatimonadota bacterium]